MNKIAVLLGNQIRIVRKNQGLSQEELAFKANINSAHLGQIERALKSPTLDTMDKIATALNVPLTALLTPCDTEDESTDDITNSNIHHLINSMTQEQQKAILKLIRAFIDFCESSQK